MKKNTKTNRFISACMDSVFSRSSLPFKEIGWFSGGRPSIKGTLSEANTEQGNGTDGFICRGGRMLK